MTRPAPPERNASETPLIFFTGESATRVTPLSLAVVDFCGLGSGAGSFRWVALGKVRLSLDFSLVGFLAFLDMLTSRFNTRLGPRLADRRASASCARETESERDRDGDPPKFSLATDADDAARESAGLFLLLLSSLCLRWASFAGEAEREERWDWPSSPSSSSEKEVLGKTLERSK